MWKEVKNFQKICFLLLPPCVFGRFFVANGLGGGRGFDVGAGGRDSQHTVFRRSGKLQGKIKYQKSKCKTTKQKSKVQKRGKCERVGAFQLIIDYLQFTIWIDGLGNLG